MKLKKILNEQLQPKVKMKVPSNVMNLLNAAIAIEKNPTRKKRLQELKGIFVGKYPHPDALLNSLKGLRKKMSSLTEAKLKRKQKIGIGLLAALMAITTLIMPTVKTAATKTVVAPPEKKVEAPISNVEARVLSIGVKQEVWDKIYNELQDYIKRLISAEYQGTEAHRQLANIFKTHNIKFANLGLSTAGAFIPETKRIQLNWNVLIRLAKNDITLEKVFGTLRHEMAHKAQFEELKKLLSNEEYNKFLQTEMSRNYVRRVIEIGAHHDEFKKTAIRLNTKQFSDYLSKQSQAIIKNMAIVYPDTDVVMKAIYKAQPNLKNLMNKMIEDQGEAAKKMKIAKEMVSKYQFIEKLVEKPVSEEWKEKVKNYLI